MECWQEANLELKVHHVPPLESSVGARHGNYLSLTRH